MPRHHKMDDSRIPASFPTVGRLRPAPSGSPQSLHGALHDDFGENSRSGKRTRQPMLPLSSNYVRERHPAHRVVEASLRANHPMYTSTDARSRAGILIRWRAASLRTSARFRARLYFFASLDISLCSAARARASSAACWSDLLSESQ